MDGDGAPAVRPRHDQLDRHVRGEVDAGRRRRLHGGRPRGRGVAVRLAHHRGHQDPRALPADEGQDPLPRRCGRRGRGGDTRAGARRGRERHGRRHRAPGRQHDGRRHGRRRAADPRGARLQRHRPLEPRRRRGSGHLRVGTRRGAGALPPAPAHPERDRAARLPRLLDPVDGGVHAVERHADPAHREGDAVRRLRHPRGEAPRDRAGRGRRVRFQAERLRRGGAGARAGSGDRPARQVDRGAERELHRHDPRPRRDARLHARRHPGREDPGAEVRRDRGHGRVLPAADAGHPRARRLGLHGPVQRPRPTGSSSAAC